MPATIFVTAFDQYALHAFDVAAVDYLVKPFKDDRFEEALRRARRLVESESRERLGVGRVELDDEQLEVIADRADVELRDALASLEAVEREAVIRRVVLEESYRAIAADLHCSEQVVRKRVSRGLARLRASLEGR